MGNYEDYINGKWKKFIQSVSMVNKKKSYPIPELEKTLFADASVGTFMVPQGVCVANSYVLISAYDGKDKKNSVLYVKDKKSAKSLVTIVLNIKCHVGALAYDEERKQIYIADSSKKGIWKLALSKVKKAVEQKETSVEINLKKESDFFAVKINPSYLTFYEDKIFVGNFDAVKAEENYAKAYTLKEDGSLKEEKIKIQLPLKSQGLAFVPQGKKLYLLASRSYGRENPSNLFVYEVKKTKDTSWAETKPLGQVVLPNMSEDIEFAGGDDVYVCFESASNKYKSEGGKKLFSSEYPIDRIVVYSFEKILKGCGM